MPRGIYERTAEHRKAMSEAHKGLSWGKHTPESKAKIGLANKAALTGKKRASPSPATRRKISEANSKTHKILWELKTKQEREMHVKNWIKAGVKASRSGKKSGTYIENRIAEELWFAGINYEQQKSFGGYYLDFYLPDYNICIECDGEYWHNTEKAIAHDKKRDKFLESFNVITIRLPGKAITKDASGIINVIKRCLKFIQ